MVNIDDMSTFCKKKGFVYPSSEIYGGMSGFFDYGPLGAEVKKNIKDSWWKFHVQSREDIVGIDGSIITHPKVWEASGHVGCFADVMLECSNEKCKEKVRADVFIEEKLKVPADGFTVDQINKAVKENKLKCDKCSSDFREAEDFNLMFKTFVGPKQDNEATAYLRPETAQIMFVDFKQIVENSRLKLPFGIAQIGRAFRNEISPRNFLFRCREFEQMEIEYFVNPDKFDECPFIDSVLEHSLSVYSADMQKENKDFEKMTIKEALDKKIIKSQWHAYWLANGHKFFVNLGAKADNFRIRQHLKTEKAHYSVDCWDLEYKFPFGWKELQGIADRGNFDLSQHMKHSKQDLSLFDEESKKKVVPHVIAEPSLGVDRAFLVFMFDAYEERVDEKTGKSVVLHLDPKLAPYDLGIFPLVNKLTDRSRELFDMLKDEFKCFFDKSGSIGRRYARADEIGIPFCITVDFDSLENEDVTIRDRDSTKQVRVKISELKSKIYSLLNGESI